MNFIPEISFAGAVVSLFLFLYNFLSKIEAKGKRYLSLIMFISFLIFAYDYLFSAGRITGAGLTFVIYYPLIFLFFPLLYKYLLFIASDDNDRTIIKIFNYLPAAVFIICSVFYFFVNDSNNLIVSVNNIYGIEGTDPKINIFIKVIFILYYIQFGIFVSVFIMMYIHHKKNQAELIKKQKPVIPHWIFFLIFAIIFYEVIYSFVMLIELFESQGYILGQTANLLLLFVVGFVSIRHDELLLEIKLNTALSLNESKRNKSNKEYHDEKKEEITSLLVDLMETHKLYRNPNVKIEHIAKRIAVPVNRLSHIINLSFNMNFSQYVNKYRIEEAIELLEQPNAKIEKVFQEVGYYTRSTFNRAFKVHTGLTPTEFLIKR